MNRGLIACIVIVAGFAVVGCGSSGPSKAEAARESQLSDLFLSRATVQPTSSSAIHTLVDIVKKECKEDDVGLGYFVAMTARTTNELNAKAFDIWCPDRAGKYRELMAGQR